MNAAHRISVGRLLTKILQTKNKYIKSAYISDRMEVMAPKSVLDVSRFLITRTIAISTIIRLSTNFNHKSICAVD